MEKVEAYIVAEIGKLLPEYEHLEVVADVRDKSYSFEFFVTMDGKRMQCYDMADAGMLEEDAIDALFKDLAKYVRTSDQYVKGESNKFSINI